MYGVDGELVDVAVLLAPLKHCASLAGKPKIVIVEVWAVVCCVECRCCLCSHCMPGRFSTLLISTVTSTAWVKKNNPLFKVYFTVVSTYVDQFLQYLAQSILRKYATQKLFICRPHLHNAAGHLPRHQIWAKMCRYVPTDTWIHFIRSSLLRSDGVNIASLLELCWHENDRHINTAVCYCGIHHLKLTCCWSIAYYLVVYCLTNWSLITITNVTHACSSVSCLCLCDASCPNELGWRLLSEITVIC